MGALDKLENFKPKTSLIGDTSNTTMQANKQKDKIEKFVSEIDKSYNVKTPLGYFLSALQKNGYDIYEETSEGVYTLTEFANMLLADDDCLVVSCAGSGKTTALVFKIMKDIITGETLKQTAVGGQMIPSVDSIFVGTFLHSGAVELKETVTKWQRKLGYYQTTDRINFGTLHAEFKRVLTAMNVPTPIGEMEAISGCLKRALGTLNIRNSEGKPLNFEDYQTIESIVCYYRNILSDRRYRHPSCNDYNLKPAILDRLVELFAEERKNLGIIDYEDLQEMLYKYLYITPNKAVQDFVANRYKYIYLDEFQDTSEIQYAILKFYARGRLYINRQERGMGFGADTDNAVNDLYTGTATKGKIIAIGDDDQCIYSWRGSSIDVMVKDYVNDFKPNILHLSKNYRCPANILNPVIPSISKNVNRYAKSIVAQNEGGEFYVLQYNSTSNMLDNLIEQIDSDMMKGYNVAVICRTNFDAVVPAMVLEMKHKYNFSVSSDTMTLKNAVPRSIMNVMRLFVETSSVGVKQALELMCPPKDKYAVKQLYDRLKSDTSVGRRTSIWTLDERDINYSCPSLYEPIMAMKKFMFDENGNKAEGGDLLAFKYALYYLMTKIFTKDNAYCVRVRAFITALTYTLNNGTFKNMEDYIEHVDDISERLSSRVIKRGTNNNSLSKAQICFVTVHEFKGKERDAVYIWHDSDKYYPAAKCDKKNMEQVEEERRVHYIACTRARKKCVIYTIARSNGMFLKEMSCCVENKSVIQGTFVKAALDTKNSGLNTLNQVDMETRLLAENLNTMEQEANNNPTEDKTKNQISTIVQTENTSEDTANGAAETNQRGTTTKTQADNNVLLVELPNVPNMALTYKTKS